MEEPAKIQNQTENILVKIAGTVGMSACGVGYLFIGMSPGDGAWPAALAISALALMGGFMAHFATRKAP